MHTNFLGSAKATRVSNAVAAGTSTINTSILDTEGFESVLWEVAFGTITSGAATSIKIQVGNDSGLSDAVDLVGPTTTVLDTYDNQLCLVEMQKLTDYRYCRLVVLRATQNAVVDCVTAYQFTGRKQPVTHDATTVADALISISPRPTSTSFTSTTTTYTGTTTRHNQTARTSS